MSDVEVRKWCNRKMLDAHRIPSSPKRVRRITRETLNVFLKLWEQPLAPLTPHIGYFGNSATPAYTALDHTLAEMQAVDHLHIITPGEVSPIGRWKRDVIAFDEGTFDAVDGTVAALQMHEHSRLTIIVFRAHNEKTPAPWADGHQVITIDRNNECAIRDAIWELVEKGGAD